MATLGKIWEIASKEMEDTKLMEKLLHDFLVIREDDAEAAKAIEKYVNKHIDKTRFNQQIAEYVYGLILDGAYVHYQNSFEKKA